MHHHFSSPHLAEALLPYAFDEQDGAHDVAHLLRVWRNVEKIVRYEGGDLEILLAATLLHDCIWIDKGSPQRRSASRLAAAKARRVLDGKSWKHERIEQVCHAIEAHSFSAGIAPVSLEARVLQDADRLDAMGFVGIARCFYVAGMRRISICDALDPAADDRPLDDAAYALDHFQTKLLKLAGGFCTAAGARMAAERTERLQAIFFQGCSRKSSDIKRPGISIPPFASVAIAL